MPLRMTIAAVLSLGLAVGAQFVAGHAAQQPPRVADPADQQASASSAAPASTGEPLEPPRVASPKTDPPATGAQDPPRVADAPGAGSTLPKLPGDEAGPPPPVVDSSSALDAARSFLDADPKPPPVVSIPDPAPESEVPSEPPAVSAPGGFADFPIVDVTTAPPAVDDFDRELPTDSPIFPASQVSALPDLDEPQGNDGFDFPEVGRMAPVEEGTRPEDESSSAPAIPDGADDFPVIDAGNFSSLPDDGPADSPIFDGEMTPPPDPGPPGGDPIFGGIAPDPAPPDATPVPDDDPLFDTPADTPEPASPPSNGGLPGGVPPDFESTSPLADPSFRTSAAGSDGVGAMAGSLGDRLSEGPREIGLNLDIAQPPKANVNLPMKAVLTLRNDGRDDAFDVVIRLPLPEGLEFVDSSPQPDEQADDGRTLVWKWTTLPPGDSRVIDLTVKPVIPVRTPLVALVSSVMAAKSSTSVEKPELKIDLLGPNSEVLKGSEFDFEIKVTNVGNGPARKVNLVATLTGGLKGFDSNGALSDAPRFEQLIEELQPGEVFGPVPLSVLADSRGTQSCKIEAISPDVVPPTPESVKIVNVVVPELDIQVAGPENRPVGSIAEYTVSITNRGTAAANNVAVALFAPESGNPEVPADAKYRQDPDKRLHSIYWQIPRLDKGESKQFRVPIRLERIALYTVEAAAHSEGFREQKDTKRHQRTTDVMGIPDIKILDVTRKDPVIDSGDTTEFEIRIKNIGSKEATNVHVDFFTNEWISVEKTDPPNAERNNENPYHHGFEPIDRLATGADRTFIVTVKALKPGPAVANFDVKIFWDGLSDTSAVSYNNYVRISEGQVARSDSGSPK